MKSPVWIHGLLTAAALAVLADSADAQLMSKPIPPLPENQEMLVLEVTLEPGHASSPHRHNAHVFVYVLEGRVTMQVAGGEPVTLSAGEMFYEDPEDVHVMSRNESDSAPARILVHMIKTVGAPATTPIPG